VEILKDFNYNNMTKIYLQYWEESERGWGVRPDGCSIHISLDDHKKYLNIIYEGRNPTEVPYEYDRVCGEPIEAFVKDSLLSVMTNGTLRLFQYEMNNLIKLKELNIIL